MQREKGFSLIELMVALAIVAILAGIALPAYTDYVLRGKLVNATNGLSTTRAQMEQYFQDNRTYTSTGTYTPPCGTGSVPASPNFGEFKVYCEANPTATAYTISAIGTGSVSAFKYTVDQNNVQTTQALKSGWGTVPSSCWILKRGATC